MSVFKVKLNNVKQGLLDTAGVSKQRQIYVAGPKRAYRLLKDGETFTDSNYWKRFAYPQVSHEFSFIEVVTDDGSVYSDIPSENTFGVGATVALTTAYSGTVVDFVTTHGGPARFLQVQNLDATIAINGQLNGDANLTFRLAAGDTQIFNTGDLAITMLKLKADSGAPNASYLASVRSVSNS